MVKGEIEKGCICPKSDPRSPGANLVSNREQLAQHRCWYMLPYEGNIRKRGIGMYYGGRSQSRSTEKEQDQNIFRCRYTPRSTFYFAFRISFGDVKNCKHLKVRFDDTLNDHGALSGSSKCIHVLEENKRRNGDILAFHLDYLQSARLQQSYYCGCTSSTELLCISCFKRVPLKAPNVVIWNTSNPTNRT